MHEFIYGKPFQVQNDPAVYRHLSGKYVKTIELDGKKFLKVDPEALEILAREAVSDISFYLRTSHLEKLSSILKDPEATDNDRFVAYIMLRNTVISSEGKLPWCQDTGTAIVIGKKGEKIEPHLSYLLAFFLRSKRAFSVLATFFAVISLTTSGAKRFTRDFTRSEICAP